MSGLRLNASLGLALAGLLPGAVQAESIVTAADYPMQALRQGHEGTVSFRVLVDEEGRPAACDITGSSGWPELDVTTCELVMRRARFKPAADKEGKPVKATWSSKFHWVIPRDPPEAAPSSKAMP